MNLNLWTQHEKYFSTPTLNIVTGSYKSHYKTNGIKF